MPSLARPETPVVDGLHIFPYYEKPEDTRPFNIRVVEDSGPDKIYQGMGVTIQERGNSDDKPWYVLEWSTAHELHEAVIALVGFASQRMDRTYYPTSNDDEVTTLPSIFYERAKAVNSDNLCIDTDRERLIWHKSSPEAVERNGEEPFEFMAFMTEGDDTKAIDDFVTQTISPEYAENIETRLRAMHSFFVAHARVFYPDTRTLVD